MVGHRKRRGAWYTPPDLVADVVEHVVDGSLVARCAGRAVRVLDPACGDARFLLAAGAAIERHGGRADLVGVDIDGAALAAVEARDGLQLFHGDALAPDADAAEWARRPYDVVVGNPPFLSQLATATSRNRASHLGGGPYADAAVEFLALAADRVDPDGGRVGLVLPQSILASRDARPVRERIATSARLRWSSWTGRQQFDADVLTCALVFEFGIAATASTAASSAAALSGASWAHVVTDRLGIPALPPSWDTAGRLGDRARLNANFRDEYYGMIPAISDDAGGPRLVTSGLIDPGRCRWGERPVRFAKRTFDAPRFDLAHLDARMSRWAGERLLPKVLVANQTPVVEAWCDASGDSLPGVPVIAIYPTPSAPDPWPIAALLTSPVASAWAWHRQGGSGLSARSIRLSPALLAELPWPAGDLGPAVDALRLGRLADCGRAVARAYGLDPDAPPVVDLATWWQTTVDRLLER